MIAELYLFAAMVVIATGTFAVTVWVMDHWLTKADKLPNPLRVRKIKKQFKAPVARRKEEPNEL